MKRRPRNRNQQSTEGTATNNTTNQTYYNKGNSKHNTRRSRPNESPWIWHNYKENTERNAEKRRAPSNNYIRTGYLPVQSKVTQIIMIPKPHKPLEEASSYRLISLLPIISKIFEKAMLKRLRPILEETRILPDNQFGFRQKHSAIERVHQITGPIRGTIGGKKKQYCCAVFLDITHQAFDNVWHPGLLFRIRKILPHAYYRILESI